MLKINKEQISFASAAAAGTTVAELADEEHVSPAAIEQGQAPPPSDEEVTPDENRDLLNQFIDS